MLLGKIQIGKTNNNHNDHHQIKGQTMHQNEDFAIFGMVKLHNFMIALRMRRNKLLLDKNIHPFSYLQRRLGAGEH